MKRARTGALAQSYFQYNKLEEKLQDILSCPNCTEIPEDSMYQCKNGHLICPGCKYGAIKCPKCQEPFGDTTIRSRVVEDILDVVICVPCDYKGAGCFETMKRKELAGHRKVCQFRPVKICATLGFPNCQVATTTGEELRKHLMDVTHLKGHGIKCCEMGTRWPNLLAKYVRASNQWTFIWRHTHGGDPMFMTHTKISINSSTKEGMFSAVIIYLGDVPENYQRYLGTLKVSMVCQDQTKCVCTRTGPPLHFKDVEDTSGIPYFTTPINYFKNQMGPEDKDFDLVLDFSVTLQLS